MDLVKYLGKDVIIKYKSGDEIKGFVEMYTDENNDPDGKPNIGVRSFDGIYLFYEDDIENIELV